MEDWVEYTLAFILIGFLAVSAGIQLKTLDNIDSLNTRDSLSVSEGSGLESDDLQFILSSDTFREYAVGLAKENKQVKLIDVLEGVNNESEDIRSNTDSIRGSSADLLSLEEDNKNQFDEKVVTSMSTDFAVTSDYPLSRLNDKWNSSAGSSIDHFGSGFSADVSGGSESFFVSSRRRQQYNPGDTAEPGVAFCVPDGEIDGDEVFRAGLIGDKNKIFFGEDSGGEFIGVERDGVQDFKEYVDIGYEDCIVGQFEMALYGAGEIKFEALELNSGRRVMETVGVHAKSGNTTINRFNLPIGFNGGSGSGDDGYSATLLSRQFSTPSDSESPVRVQSARVSSISIDDSKWYEVATFRKDIVEVPVSITTIEAGSVPCNFYSQVRIDTRPSTASYEEFTFQNVADSENAVEVSTADSDVNVGGSPSGYNIGGLQLFESSGKKNVKASDTEELFGEIGEEPASVLFKATEGSSCTVQDIVIATAQRR